MIGSDRGVIPEMIKEGVTGIIYKNSDVDDLVRAVTEFELNTEEELSVSRINCLDECKSNYSKESYMKRFRDCVNEVL